MKKLNDLRDLRLWHYKECLRLRKIEKFYLTTIEKGGPRSFINEAKKLSKDFYNSANFHLKAVQLLNDVVDGTAENDMKPKGKTL